MYITQMDLIKQRLSAEHSPSNEEIIADLIRRDASSSAKRDMAEGTRYYLGDHDVLRRDFTRSIVYERPDGSDTDRELEFRNRNRSNQHDVNRFHTLLVNQKVGYVVGKEPSFDAGGDKILQEAVSSRTDEVFCDTLTDYIIGTANKGEEWLHFYRAKNGELRYCITPAEGIIAIYDDEHQDELVELIRYYTYTIISGNREVHRYKAEWWTAETVTYYIQDEDERFRLDTDHPYNPAPHWWSVTSVDGVERTRERQSWGRVPFIPLRNNSACQTDLQPIKGLIDAYDLISSMGTNDVLDLVGFYFLISGYGGEAASAIIKRLQVNRAANVNSSDGALTAHQVNLSAEERLNWMTMLRRDIFRFGMGFDVDLESVGNATNVALNLQYGLLDLKSDALIRKLKRALKEWCWFVVEDYNRLHGTALDAGKITITINKSRITNEKELVDMVVAAYNAGILPEKIALEQLPLVVDADAAMKLLEKEKADAAKRQRDMFRAGDYKALGDDE